MGYLQALQLMVRAYKAARGVMPKGLDLLKLKLKARQKAIDSKKVIEFPKDRITDPFKPRPQGIEKLIKKGDVKIGKAPKTTKVKEPVDPKLIMQESEKQTLARMRKENKEAIKRFKEKMDKPRDGKANGGPIDPGYLGIPPEGYGIGSSRPGGTPYPSLDYYDDDAGVRGLMKKRKKKKKKREKKATGGLANVSAVYDNNPTLQAQYPNKQDYLDLFSSTTTTTPQTQTYAQMTQQQPAAGIPAVQSNKLLKPFIPGAGQDDGSDDDIDISNTFITNQPNYMGGKVPGFIAGVQRGITGLKQIPSLTKLGFQFVKDAGQSVIDNFKAAEEKERARQKAIALAFEEEMRRREEDRIRSQSPTGSTYSGPSGYEGMSDAASQQEMDEGGRGSRG